MELTQKEPRPAAGACAVIWCRDFRLQAVVRGKPGSHELPRVLVDETRRQSVVLCANAAAGAAGVRAGLPTVQAIARCPDLQVERPSAPAEQVAGRLLLETALSWVPGVEESAPGILTLDLSSQPEAHWIGSAHRLCAHLGQCGLQVAVGIGETAALARIAAQAALREGLPVWHLDPAERLAQLDRLPLLVAETGAVLNEKLVLWGLHSLGAFARLRRDEVAARLGDEGVELWLRLSGRLRRPLVFAKLEELFEVHQDFEHEVVEREALFFLLRRFLGDLVVRVGATGRVATALHLLLTFADGTCVGRRLALPEPTLDEEVLFRLAAGHVEAMEIKAAMTGVRLRLEPSDPVASQRPLFGAGLRNRHHCEETLTRLRRIVGADRLGSPRLPDTHRPGGFVRAALPAELEESAGPAGGPPVTGLVLRRYPVACRAAVQLREGRPLRVESPRVTGVVVSVQGPWRSAGDWWHRGRGWERSEWDVELLNRGLFRLVESARGWSVEGYYD